jgi:hypothetical protein
MPLQSFETGRDARTLCWVLGRKLAGGPDGFKALTIAPPERETRLTGRLKGVGGAIHAPLAAATSTSADAFAGFSLVSLRQWGDWHALQRNIQSSIPPSERVISSTPRG